MIVEAARVAGGKLVVVDAIDEHAAAFSQRHDFQPMPRNRSRLIVEISTVAQALDLPWAVGGTRVETPLSANSIGHTDNRARRSCLSTLPAGLRGNASMISSCSGIACARRPFSFR